MRRFLLVFLLVFACTLGLVAHAQFTLQTSNSTASLRGIAAVTDQVAWASGSSGTVLHTVDGGATWLACATPPDAAKLDFRGVQAFDAKTALVMSSGKGDLSRIYKTTDGCATWKLVFSNPDADGFFDAMVFRTASSGYVLGDPVAGRFVLLATTDGGVNWRAIASVDLATVEAAGAFAASNTSMVLGQAPSFGGGGSLFYMGDAQCTMMTAQTQPVACVDAVRFNRRRLPIEHGSPASGIFSLAVNGNTWMAVGGDYTKPTDAQATAAVSADGGQHWTAATTMPHGYRSAVAYDAASKTWIATGPSGTDVSIDDGKNWRALLPDAAQGDAADSDSRWNALSLPFVVGSKGRIGRLRSDALHK